MKDFIGMKIALLSFVENLNYGGSLQIYALEKAIENRYADVECEYIKYRKNQFKATTRWMARKIVSSIVKRNDAPSWTVKEYVHILWDSFYQNSCKNGRSNICLFNEFWQMSNYSDSVSRKKLMMQEKYDLYIVGSDQVWNCGRLDLDTTFLLDFVKDNQKKGCYAPSLALEKIPEKYFDKYQYYWKQFRWLSCREKKGADMISTCTGREVVSVLDPVFLLSEDQWEKVEKRPHNISENAEFFLIYTLSDKKDYIPYIETFVKNNRLQIVSIYGDISKTDMVGPAEWVWYFHNAKYIVTDSFHGTAFSIIFRKQFYSRIPEDDFFRSSSDRITDLLQQMGLQERILKDKRQLLTSSWIDYEEVQKILDEKRKESFDYLDGMIING